MPTEKPKYLTFSQFVEQKLANDTNRYPTEQDRVKAAAFMAWEYQRELARPMAEEIDLMSRILGRLPAPLCAAVCIWKGMVVPQAVQDALEDWEARQADLLAQSAAAVVTDPSEAGPSGEPGSGAAPAAASPTAAESAASGLAAADAAGASPADGGTTGTTGTSAEAGPETTKPSP